MKLEKRKKWNYPAIGFAIPCLGMLFVMAVSQYAPFGKYSMLYSDMYHQYYPFFVAFRNALREGRGLLYTWSVGLGMDYLGLIAYYLASPLNLLSVLVPEGWLLGYFSLLVPIKLGLAGLFFSLFLKHIFHRDDLSISVFGGFYGLCAWALGYQWNVMWLDTFALLPLVALGTVSLLKEKKVVLYTVSLFFSVFCLPDLPVGGLEEILPRLGAHRPVFRHCHRHVGDPHHPGPDGSGHHPVQCEQIPNHLPAEHCETAHHPGPAGCHAPGGGEHGRQPGAYLQGGTSEPVLRHCQRFFHVPVFACKGSAAPGQNLRRGAAAVLQCQLHYPSAGLYLAWLSLHQYDPLPVQLPVQLRGAVHVLPGLDIAPDLRPQADRPGRGPGRGGAGLLQSAYRDRSPGAFRQGMEYPPVFCLQSAVSGAILARHAGGKRHGNGS